MTDLAAVPPTRPLGRAGITVSSLAWGMWRFAGQSPLQARTLVEAALAAGITLFDTADVYGADTAEGFGSAEVLLGSMLADAPGLRARIVLATKGGIVPGVPYDQSPVYVEAAVDASLRRLCTEHVELWQVHRPDILTHPHELGMAVARLFDAGKIGAFGVSNFTVAQTQTLQMLLPGGLTIAATQPELSSIALTAIGDGTLDLAMAHDIAVLAWSPLGGGRIAKPQTPTEDAVAVALDAVAQASGVSRAAAAYAWIMAHPARPIPIVGSQNAARIAEASDAFRVRYTRRDWYGILAAARGEALP